MLPSSYTLSSLRQMFFRPVLTELTPIKDPFRSSFLGLGGSALGPWSVRCVLRSYFGQNARDLGVPVDNDLSLGSGSAQLAKGRSGDDGRGARRSG